MDLGRQTVVFATISGFVSFYFVFSLRDSFLPVLLVLKCNFQFCYFNCMMLFRAPGLACVCCRLWSVHMSHFVYARVLFLAVKESELGSLGLLISAIIPREQYL